MRETAFTKYAQLSSRNPVRPWDRVLLSTDNFVVVPTRGAIVDGWVLVVPKTFHLCFGSLHPSLAEERDFVIATVARAIEDVYGSVMFFEHGPHEASKPLGCGVDHAHLHALPSVCDMRRGADAIWPGIDWRSAEGLNDTGAYFNAQTSYLYHEQPIGSSWIGIHERPTSQLFRRVIANAVGESHAYDWRAYPREENARRTAVALAEMRLRTTQVRLPDLVLSQ